MHATYHEQWYNTLTFTQKNEFYKADTLAGTSVWYEAIEYPKNFRIDLGDPKNGNAVIFRNDSLYSFKEGVLKKAVPRKNTLTFLLGGMYHMPFEEVEKIMLEEGYDLSKGFRTEKQGKAVWVIGADSADEKSNQLWIDLDNLLILKISYYKDSQKVDALFEDHIKVDRGWCETKVTFYIDDVLYQVERYSEIATDVWLDPAIFDPNRFGKVHWLSEN